MFRKVIAGVPMLEPLRIVGAPLRGLNILLSTAWIWCSTGFKETLNWVPLIPWGTSFSDGCTVYTEKTMFPFPFILNGICSWWQFSFRYHHDHIPFNLKRNGNTVFSVCKNCSAVADVLCNVASDGLQYGYDQYISTVWIWCSSGFKEALNRVPLTPRSTCFSDGCTA